MFLANRLSCCIFGTKLYPTRSYHIISYTINWPIAFNRPNLSIFDWQTGDDFCSGCQNVRTSPTVLFRTNLTQTIAQIMQTSHYFVPVQRMDATLLLTVKIIVIYKKLIITMQLQGILHYTWELKQLKFRISILESSLGKQCGCNKKKTP